MVLGNTADAQTTADTTIKLGAITFVTIAAGCVIHTRVQNLCFANNRSNHTTHEVAIDVLLRERWDL